MAIQNLCRNLGVSTPLLLLFIGVWGAVTPLAMAGADPEAVPKAISSLPTSTEPSREESLAEEAIEAIAREQAEQHFRLGEAAQEQSQAEKALGLYSAAIALDPSHIRALASRAGLRGMMQDFEGAIADYSSLIVLQPELAPAYGGRGIAHAQSGDLTAATQDLWQAAQLFKAEGNMEAYGQTLTILERIAP